MKRGRGTQIDCEEKKSKVLNKKIGILDIIKYMIDVSYHQKQQQQQGVLLCAYA